MAGESGGAAEAQPLLAGRLLSATPITPSQARRTRLSKLKFFVCACLAVAGMSGLLAAFKVAELQWNRYTPPANPLREAVPSGNGVLKIAVLGDWGRRGNAPQTAVAKSMGEVCAERQCDLVISVGDNFYNNGVSGIGDPHWRLSFEEVYTAPSLNTTWLVALGNHDYFGGSVQAQLDYTALRTAGGQQRRWTMPARYFVRTLPVGDKKLALFFLDTSPLVSMYRAPLVNRFMSDIMSQDPAEQCRWLQEALEASTADIKIAVGHHPVFSAGHRGDSEDLMKHVRPLLEQYGVPLYISGHDHDLQHIAVPRAGFQQLISGGGSSTGAYLGRRRDGGLRWGDEGAGFMVLSVAPDGAVYVEAFSHAAALLYAVRLF